MKPCHLCEPDSPMWPGKLSLLCETHKSLLEFGASKPKPWRRLTDREYLEEMDRKEIVSQEAFELDQLRDEVNDLEQECDTLTADLETALDRIAMLESEQDDHVCACDREHVE